MNTTHFLKLSLSVLFLVLGFISCSEKLDPEPVFSASIKSTSGEEWEATDGGMVLFQYNERGGIRVRLTILCQAVTHDLNLVISSTDLSTDYLEPFEFKDLEEDRKGFGTYRVEAPQKTWEPIDHLSVEMNVASLNEVNGRYFASGSFQFYGCNQDLSPVCIGQSGVFENMKVQNGTRLSEILLSCN